MYFDYLIVNDGCVFCVDPFAGRARDYLQYRLEVAAFRIAKEIGKPTTELVEREYKRLVDELLFLKEGGQQ